MSLTHDMVPVNQDRRSIGSLKGFAPLSNNSKNKSNRKGRELGTESRAILTLAHKGKPGEIVSFAVNPNRKQRDALTPRNAESEHSRIYSLVTNLRTTGKIDKEVILRVKAMRKQDDEKGKAPFIVVIKEG